MQMLKTQRLDIFALYAIGPLRESSKHRQCFWLSTSTFLPPPPPRWPLRNCVKQSRGALIAKADVAAHTVLRCACALDTLAYSIFKATSNAQSEIEEGCNARTASGANLKLEVWLISNHCPALPRRRQCCRATVINPSHTCVLHLCLCTV